MSCCDYLPDDPNKGCGAKIKAVIFFKSSDMVYDKDGNILRVKRKYGKFDRQMVKIDYPQNG